MKKNLKVILLCIISFQFLMAQEDEKHYPSLDLSGYVQFHVLKDYQHSYNDGFSIYRARIKAEGDLSENFFYAFEMNPLSAPSYEDVFLGYHINQVSDLKLGYFKIPFGIENPTSSKKLDLIYRSKIVNQIFNEREFGLSYFAHTDLLNVNFGYFQRPKHNYDRIERDAIGRFGIEPFDKRLILGVSGYYEAIIMSKADSLFYDGQTQPAKNFKKLRYGADFRLVMSPVKLQTEIIWGKANDLNPDLNILGYYATFQYGFEINGILYSLVVRGELLDPNVNEAKDNFRSITGGLNIYLNKQIKISLNHIYNSPEENYNFNSEIGDKIKGHFAILQVQYKFESK